MARAREVFARAYPRRSSEALLLDQGSSPRVATALRSLAETYGLTYRRSPRTGWNKGRNLNEGLRAASGALVLCLDLDHIIPPDLLIAFSARARTRPRTRHLFSVRRVYGLPPPLVVPGLTWEGCRDLQTHCTGAWTLGSGGCLGGPRRLLLSLGGFSPLWSRRLGEDHELLARALLHGCRISYLPESLTVFHQLHRLILRGGDCWQSIISRHGNLLLTAAGRWKPVPRVLQNHGSGSPPSSLSPRLFATAKTVSLPRPRERRCAR